LVFPYVEKGMYADALAELDKWQQIQQTPWSLSIRAYVLGRSGQQVQARQKMSKLEQITTQPIDPLAFALAYVGINDKKRALLWLERAYAEHSSSLTALKVDPIYDSLRDDPRFQDLLGRIHLAQ
jgi:adenylate cyclase